MGVRSSTSAVFGVEAENVRESRSITMIGPSQLSELIANRPRSADGRGKTSRRPQCRTTLPLRILVGSFVPSQILSQLLSSSAELVFAFVHCGDGNQWSALTAVSVRRGVDVTSAWFDAPDVVVRCNRSLTSLLWQLEELSEC